MRLLAAGAVLAVVLAPVAAAKMRMALGLSDGTPTVGQMVRVTLTTERALTDFELQYGLHVVAVAPRAACSSPLRAGSIDSLNRCERKNMYAVISKAVTHEPLARSRGWMVPITQTYPTTWAGTITFTRPGRWLLVVPNGPTVGYGIPPPVVRAVPVRST